VADPPPLNPEDRARQLVSGAVVVSDVVTSYSGDSMKRCALELS
jgi:hypothetical protein